MGNSLFVMAYLAHTGAIGGVPCKNGFEATAGFADRYQPWG